MKAKEIYQYVLAAIIVAGFFSFLYLIATTPMPESNKDMLMIGGGTLFSLVGLVIGYFFGSSMGSSKKTDIMAANKANDQL